MWRKIPLLLPLILIVITSGCTLPGGFCIPGFPCAPTHEEAHDVYVISSLDALPKEVSPDQDIRLVAIVENRATRAPEEGQVTDKEIRVELYDYCEGLFEIVKGKSSDRCDEKGKCTIESLIPGEKTEIHWTLHSNKDTKLLSTCSFKIRAGYQYTTNSVTQIYLIDYTEMQRMLNEGTFQQQSSPYSGSFGPLKPYLTLEDTQPIPVPAGDDKINTVFGFQIKNKGKGVLTNCPAKDGHNEDDNEKEDTQNPGISSGQVEIKAQGQEMKAGDKSLQDLLIAEINELNNHKLILIGSESPKLILSVSDLKVGSVPVKTTKLIETTIKDYCYEFRKEIDVKVKPKV